MVKTTNTICYPLDVSFNCFGGASWTSSNYINAATTDIKEWGGLGRNTSNVYRTTVIKFTTPTLRSGMTNKKLNIRFSARSNNLSATNTGNFYYRIKTSGPSFSSNSSQFPAADASGVFSGTSTITFTSNTSQRFKFTTSAHNFASNTTYYLWLLSEAPKGGAIGYIQNDSTHGRIELDFECTDTVTYTLISYAGLAHHNGFYSGAKVGVTNSDEAVLTSGYVYCNWSGKNDAFYGREIENNTSWSRMQYGFTLDANTSITSTYRTLYMFHASKSVGNPVYFYPKLSTTDYITTYKIPRFACLIYEGTSTPTLYINRDSTNITIQQPDGWTYDGMSNTSTSTTMNIDIAGESWQADFDGKTYYCIYEKNTEGTYYRGSATPEIATIRSILYGTGQKTTPEIAIVAPPTECASDNTYTFQGFARSPNTISVTYNSLEDAFMDTTVCYGVYSKDFDLIAKSGSLNTGGALKTWTLNQTDGTNYYYGTGQHTTNSEMTYEADFNYNGNIPYTTIAPTGDMEIGGTNYYKLDSILTALEKANNGDTIIVEYEGTDTLTYLDMDGTIYDPVTLRILINNFLYGTKVKLIPSESYPVAYQPPNNNKFLGWYDAYGDKLNFTYDSYYADWTINDMSIRQVSPKLELANDIYYGKNGEWKKAKIYKGINGQWVPVLMRYGKNSEWKNDYSYFNFTAFGARVAYNGQTWADWLASDMNVDYRLQLNDDGVVCQVTSMGLMPVIREGFTEDIYGTDKIIEGAVYKTTL